MIGGLGYGPLSFTTDSAEVLARQALSRDDGSAEAHTSLAGVLTDQANWPRAEQEYRKAIALRPGYAQAHAWYAALLVTLDRKAEALREIRRASDLDPLTQPIMGLRVQIETYAGVRANRNRPGERKGLVDPTHPGTIAIRSVSLARAKRCPEAYAENRNAQQLAPNVTMIQLTLVGVRTLCGQPALARALLDTVEQHPDARLMSVYIAEVHAARGDRDSAFAWLEKGQWGMGGRMELRMGRQLDPLRSDPRFPRLLHSVGMP
jgi:Flp pilus assembly protein TadD